jgi:hypothetical protein
MFATRSAHLFILDVFIARSTSYEAPNGLIYGISKSIQMFRRNILPIPSELKKYLTSHGFFCSSWTTAPPLPVTSWALSYPHFPNAACFYWFLPWLTLLPWRCRQYVPAKRRWAFTRLSVVAYDKTVSALRFSSSTYDHLTCDRYQHELYMLWRLSLLDSWCLSHFWGTDVALSYVACRNQHNRNVTPVNLSSEISQILQTCLMITMTYEMRTSYKFLNKITVHTWNCNHKYSRANITEVHVSSVMRAPLPLRVRSWKQSESCMCQGEISSLDWSGCS